MMSQTSTGESAASSIRNQPRFGPRSVSGRSAERKKTVRFPPRTAVISPFLKLRRIFAWSASSRNVRNVASRSIPYVGARIVPVEPRGIMNALMTPALVFPEPTPPTKPMKRFGENQN